MSNGPTAPPNGQGLFMQDGFGHLSRRDFIRQNLALLALAGTSSCRWPVKPPDERSAFRLVRAEDLLALNFELRNLRIQHRWRKPARLVRIREGEDALLIVGFPGQHIFEQAYPEKADAGSISLPAKARIARPSRLVFKIPPERSHIDLTFDALLDWREWMPMLPEADGNGRIVSPPAERSVVELPYGLALTPQETARWRHAIHPLTHKGRTELWHTRLLPREAHQPLTVRILQPAPPADDLRNVMTSLDTNDRNQLAGQTARAHTLILSAMGGWLDVRGRWESASPIARWKHTATAGQDQRVVVQRKDGFLYPFGQRGALITVTERKLVRVNADRPHQALLRQRDFVVIKQPVVAYAHAEMALQRMTALDLATPPLHNARRDGGPFWIETGPEAPFRFRFRARDWAERQLFLEAPAIFVSDPNQLAATKALYEDQASAARRTIPLRGQPAAVVQFDSAVGGDKDRWDEPLDRQRSAKDTTLNLLQIEFAGGERSSLAAGVPPFACRTRRMEVRLPSLEPYLSDEKNKGWFELVDPDPPDNLGEILAQARTSDGARIPMYFDNQADRSGGVAAPSFDVDGLSRVRGPVGDARPGGPMYRGGQLDPETYFNPEHARLLGGFPLTRLLLTDSGAKSPAVPTIQFILSQKQPDPKKNGEGAPLHREIGLGLAWRVALQERDAGIARFVPDVDKKGNSRARLAIDARLTKALGKPATPDGKSETGEAADATKQENSPNKPAPSSVTWRVSGKITNFAIALETGALGEISIGFAHLGVALGPPPPEKKKTAKEEEKDQKETKEAEKKKKIAATIDYKMSAIKADGVLFFLIKLIQMAADLPRIPDISVGAPSSVSQAKLPGVDDADISVMAGPVELPTPAWKWLDKFEVTNLAVSVGVGLYFLPRRLKETEPPRVPGNLFTIRIASADRPLTLMAEPWGGLAHVGFNFTPKGMTGFQSGIGIVYRAAFDLGNAKVKCEGSLTGVFTYQIKDDGKASYQVALVLKLNGQAVIAGFIDIHLTIVAAGFWEIETNRWVFSAEITVRIKISFFAVSARFQFNYELSGGGGGDRMLAEAAAVSDTGRLTESEWRAYCAAFAKEA